MRIRFIPAAAAALLLAACSNPAAPAPFVGTYHLVTVNGMPIPVTIGGYLQITTGSLQMDASHTYRFSYTEVGLSTPGSDTAARTGTWAENGAEITLYFSSTSAVLGTATFNAPGMTVKYGRVYGFLPD